MLQLIIHRIEGVNYILELNPELRVEIRLDQRTGLAYVNDKDLEIFSYMKYDQFDHDDELMSAFKKSIESSILADWERFGKASDVGHGDCFMDRRKVLKTLIDELPLDL